jgi:hypothetical protein
VRKAMPFLGLRRIGRPTPPERSPRRFLSLPVTRRSVRQGVKGRMSMRRTTTTFDLAKCAGMFVVAAGANKIRWRMHHACGQNAAVIGPPASRPGQANVRRRLRHQGVRARRARRRFRLFRGGQPGRSTPPMAPRGRARARTRPIPSCRASRPAVGSFRHPPLQE